MISEPRWAKAACKRVLMSVLVLRKSPSHVGSTLKRFHFQSVRQQMHPAVIHCTSNVCTMAEQSKSKAIRCLLLWKASAHQENVITFLTCKKFTYQTWQHLHFERLKLLRVDAVIYTCLHVLSCCVALTELWLNPTLIFFIKSGFFCCSFWTDFSESNKKESTPIIYMGFCCSGPRGSVGAYPSSF